MGASLTRWMKADNLICGIGCIILIVLVITVYAVCTNSVLSGLAPYLLVLVTAVVAIAITTVSGILDVSILIYILVSILRENDD